MKQIALLALLTCSLLIGQGYDKTRWGMTREQVQKAYPLEKFRPNPAEGGFFMDRNVAGAPCEIKFLFKGTKSGLSEVRIAIARDFDITDQYGRQEYAHHSGEIRRALEGTYGPGETRDQIRLWQVKDTITRMISLRVPGGMEIFEVHYSSKKAPAAGL